MKGENITSRDENGHNADTPLVYRSLFIGDISSVDKGLHLFAKVGGGAPIKFMVDTGSTGIVVGRSLLKDNEYTPTKDKFCLVYSSSGRRYYGHWVEAVISFYSSKGEFVLGKAVAKTVKMKIRMVEAAYDGNGSPIEDPATCMMGVGFDRDTGTGLDPDNNLIFDDINPFLMIDEMKTKGMVPGFILMPSCIMLGISSENTQGFSFIQLVRQAPSASSHYSPSNPQWAAPNVNISVPTANIPPMLANLLIDTGLGYSIIQAPLGTAPPQAAVLEEHCKCRVQVAVNQRIVITIPGLSQPLYSYTVGEPSVAPDWVSWRHNLHAGMPFVNTSMHALSSFDYLYDDSNGRLGFRFRNSGTG
jgi:hypothetical protein